jgi:hypothetical protein
VEPRPQYTGHLRLDQRSLAMHRAIAAKLTDNPALVGLARANLDRWSGSTDPRSAPYFEQWRQLLNLPVPELAALLQEDSERMTALRQCSPFAGALEPKERWAIYDAFAVGTHHPGSRDDRG